jgi:erythronate-4-phosphate dehydrogenase
MGRKYDIDLEDKSIGIIGVGNVGSRVATKCAALGMQIYLNDPPLQRETGEGKYLPLEELYDCDFITLHTPLTFEGVDKTYHLADEKFFKSLRERCVFVNASRGGVVDSEALKTAIRSGRLRAVVLDVWENEPNIDTQLLKIVDIGTPHIAGYSLDGKVAGMIMIYKSACECVIALGLGYTARWEVRSGQAVKGESMATVGIVLGWIGVGVAIVGICLAFSAILLGLAAIPGVAICSSLRAGF